MTPRPTPEQAAKELGIGVDTLSAMRKAGDIPYVNIGRGRKRETPRYDLDDPDRLAGKEKATGMSVFIRPDTKDGTYSFRFNFKGQPFSGNTGTTRKREAERIRAAQREKAKREWEERKIRSRPPTRE